MADVDQKQSDGVWCVCRSTKVGVSIECDSCHQWYHLSCVGLTKLDPPRLLRYHCPDCFATSGPSVYKQAARRSSRAKQRHNYAAMEDGVLTDDNKYAKILAMRNFGVEHFPRMKGAELTVDFVRNGWDTPIMIEEPDGLEMKMPPSTFTVADVARVIGGQRQLNVIQVSTQQELLPWTLYQWSHYFAHPEIRTEILNVISLEFSDTPMAALVQRPRIVEELDMISWAWPLSDLERRPKVQLYCLMSVAGSYTDFHIDFAGTSVFYHVISGEKIFYFIKPTAEHLRKYEQWTSSDYQSSIFFADEVSSGECVKCRIVAGQTLFIPSGWIHAVHTPVDSLVIGGNFLHIHAMQMQFAIDKIERRTHVAARFRFPSHLRLHWYVLKHIVTTIISPNQQHEHCELSDHDTAHEDSTILFDSSKVWFVSQPNQAQQAQDTSNLFSVMNDHTQETDQTVHTDAHNQTSAHSPQLSTPSADPFALLASTSFQYIPANYVDASSLFVEQKECSHVETQPRFDDQESLVSGSQPNEAQSLLLDTHPPSQTAPLKLEASEDNSSHTSHTTAQQDDILQPELKAYHHLYEFLSSSLPRFEHGDARKFDIPYSLKQARLYLQKLQQFLVERSSTNDAASHVDKRRRGLESFQNVLISK